MGRAGGGVLFSTLAGPSLPLTLLQETLCWGRALTPPPVTLLASEGCALATSLLMCGWVLESLRQVRSLLCCPPWLSWELPHPALLMQGWCFPRPCPGLGLSQLLGLWGPSGNKEQCRVQVWASIAQDLPPRPLAARLGSLWGGLQGQVGELSRDSPFRLQKSGP